MQSIMFSVNETASSNEHVKYSPCLRKSSKCLCTTDSNEYASQIGINLDINDLVIMCPPALLREFIRRIGSTAGLRSKFGFPKKA
jgi:hypothetical protein